jgi:hypothetical protein
MIFCRGNYSEMGERHGELLGKEIRENLTFFWRILGAGGHQKNEWIRKALSLEALHSSERLEEIDGIRRSAEVPYPELLAYNSFYSFAFPEECTVLMAVGNAGVMGHNIFLKIP